MPSLDLLLTSLKEREHVLADGVYNGIVGAAIKYLSSRNGNDSLRFGAITAAGTVLYDWYTSQTSSMILEPLRVTSVSAYTALITYLLGGSAQTSVNDALLSVASSTTSSMAYASKYDVKDEQNSVSITSSPPPAWHDAVSS